MSWSSFVALGDSFTEGMDDSYPDGTYRGWADLVAARLAVDSGPRFGYANLAVRGKVLDEVLTEQVGHASRGGTVASALLRCGQIDRFGSTEVRRSPGGSR